MMNFEKYRAIDTIQLVGLDAAVFQENEDGELIDPICWKDADWISGKPIRARAEQFNFEEYTLNAINDHFYPELKPLDIVVCGNTLQFWIREDADGYCDEDGEYFVLYVVALKINGMIIDDEDELASLLPSFEY